mmetsp:Transcript_74737/g.112654  ORF Transcript_74737/g.112654 Transcript_74737/m.112654 type:complete len:206 (-) Transcript_74737:117-734(-)
MPPSSARSTPTATLTRANTPHARRTTPRGRSAPRTRAVVAPWRKAKAPTSAMFAAPLPRGTAPTGATRPPTRWPRTAWSTAPPRRLARSRSLCRSATSTWFSPSSSAASPPTASATRTSPPRESNLCLLTPAWAATSPMVPATTTPTSPRTAPTRSPATRSTRRTTRRATASTSPPPWPSPSSSLPSALPVASPSCASARCARRA